MHKIFKNFTNNKNKSSLIMYNDRTYGRSDRGYGYKRERRSGFGADDIREMEPKGEEVKFEKNFYNPNSTLSEDEAYHLRTSSKMRIQGDNVPLPIKDFDSINFPHEIINHFKSKGYKTPTAIQAQGWPMALQGRDMVGIADTGSGKTISFVLPALIHAKAQAPLREDDGPIVLILAPTRELCTQIEEVVREYTPFFNLRSTSVYGGASIVPQKKALKRGCEVVVATPGRLIDLHKQGFCPLNRVSFLVLDEADRMLDMGFEPQLNQIIPQTNKNRQSLMWSATWPREVRALANDFLKNYIQVTIGDDELKANDKILQKVEVVDYHDKKNKLLYYIQDRRSDRIIVFCNMKRTCDVIEDFLGSQGFSAVAIHGDKSQAARDSVISMFKAGRKTILIATDVAARGLDIEGVKLVINYDFPKSVEDYVHRIGRTARGHVKEGLAYTMFCKDDAGNAKKFVEILRQSKQDVPAELEQMARSSRGPSSNSSRGPYYNKGNSFSGGYGQRRSLY
jgi:ATP-dependent RNA helicase DDX5/DBP2